MILFLETIKKILFLKTLSNKPLNIIELDLEYNC